MSVFFAMILNFTMFSLYGIIKWTLEFVLKQKIRLVNRCQTTTLSQLTKNKLGEMNNGSTNL